MSAHNGRIFALLVGINDYAPSVGKLRGCLNDVANYEDWLKARLPADRLALEVLTDSDATRGNIIASFRSHLGQAGLDDVVLFQYSGHGARWKSAEAFRDDYPDGMDEGLVCYDSRGDGGYDLADKELAVLLAEVGHNAPHIAVVLDCCHSGSGTRGADDFTLGAVRQTRQRDDARPLESYLDGYYAELAERGESLAILSSRHMLLAACERVQKAWEAKDHSGVFSTSLLDALARANGDLTYAALFTRTRAAVTRFADNQTPQFETYGGFDAYQGFLGGAAGRRDRPYSVFFADDTWKVNCGAIHGLPTDPDRAAELALYPESERDVPVGHARVVAVGAQQSEVEFVELEVDRGTRFEAGITTLPVPPMPVVLEGDADAVAAFQDAFAEARDRSLGFTLETESGPGIRYGLTARDGVAVLAERDGGRDLQRVPEAPQVAAALLFPSLARIATWERLVGLDNPHTRMDRSGVDFRFVEIDADGVEQPFDRNPTDITVDYRQTEDGWQLIEGRLLSSNLSRQTLHLALAIFSDDFGIQVIYNERIEPTDDPFPIVVDGDDAFDIELDEGVDEIVFVCKLIVSTERLDDFLLSQEPLELGEFRSAGQVEKGTRGIAFGKNRRKPKHRNEWFTKTIRVRVTRRLDRVSDSALSLANGSILIKGHPQFQADASLGVAKGGGRGVSAGADFHRALEGSGLDLIGFGKTRGEPENMLELTGIEHADALEETPLEIELDLGLGENEYLLPMTFDGKDILLAGEPDRTDGGRALVRIDHIPEGIPDNRRSLGKALKLYFFKTYLKRGVNRLCWVKYGDAGKVIRHEDRVKDKVAVADNILLLVHGIIGDTEVMAAGLPDARDSGGVSVADRFDLILTFDFENLSTSIEDTALLLKSQLREVGLNEHDDKRLTLLVHSMGGLVSRWFIEQTGGNAVVDHLVMCGTPNAGSPFGKIDSARNLTGVLTTWAINAFPAFAPFGAGLLTALARSRKISATLEQMNPGSEFIRRLNAGNDPGVRYSIVAGDIRQFEETSEALIARLTEKIGKGPVFDALYPDQGHDIAVSLDSIQGVPEPRQPAPVRHEIVCHHLNYFASEIGLAALASVDW